MRVRLIVLLALVCSVGGTLWERSATAALTPAQRRELLTHERTLSRVASLLNRKDVEEAEKLLKETEASINKIIEDAKAPPNDPTVTRLKRSIDRQRATLSKLTGEEPEPGDDKPGTVSYTKDVAPIIQKYCGSCHGGNPRGELTLTSAAGIAKGGKSGAAITPGNPNTSRMLQRIVAGTMPPKGRPRPTPREVTILATWVNEGAKSDAPEDNLPKVDVPKPTGNETVSFTRDVAPFMVNLCVGCHSGNTPRGGLSLTTVRNMMIGGDSGEVIIPGDSENSRLFRLVGGLENPRMPQGQARITRKNYEDLKKWFQEGNKFDVEDIDRPLRDIVPTAQELAAERLAKLTPEEFSQMRLQRGHESWISALPKQTYRVFETEDFFVMGNVAEDRLRQVGQWAETQGQQLRKLFNQPESEPLWKGKLSVFVLKDRFDFGEFNLIIERRDAPQEMTGYSKVTANTEDAYAVVLDLGDESSAASPTLKTILTEHITGAYLQREGSGLPDWLSRGTGLALAARSAVPAKPGEQDPYIANLKSVAVEALKKLTKPEDVFADGQFAPSTVGAVGYTLVDYMMDVAGPARFGQFIRALQSGTNLDTALKNVYGSDRSRLAAAYLSQIASRR